MRLGKVYHDLNESTYLFKYQRFTFVFSSKFYIEKFKKELSSYVDIEQEKIIDKYQVNLEGKEYLALSLYKKIEKRGFKVYFNDEVVEKNQGFTINISYLRYI